MRFEAARRFDRQQDCGAQANMALLLAADAAWKAANTAIQTFGGYGYDVEYDVERKFRETRLFQIAPISTNLILAHSPSMCSGFRDPSDAAQIGP